MSQAPQDPQGEPATEAPDRSEDSPQLQELTLEQLDAHIAHAESLHRDLSERLDAIPRD